MLLMGVEEEEAVHRACTEMVSTSQCSTLALLITGARRHLYASLPVRHGRRRSIESDRAAEMAG